MVISGPQQVQAGQPSPQRLPRLAHACGASCPPFNTLFTLLFHSYCPPTSIIDAHKMMAQHCLVCPSRYLQSLRPAPDHFSFLLENSPLTCLAYSFFLFFVLVDQTRLNWPETQRNSTSDIVENKCATAAFALIGCNALHRTAVHKYPHTLQCTAATNSSPDESCLNRKQRTGRQHRR